MKRCGAEKVVSDETMRAMASRGRERSNRCQHRLVGSSDGKFRDA